MRDMTDGPGYAASPIVTGGRHFGSQAIYGSIDIRPGPVHQKDQFVRCHHFVPRPLLLQLSASRGHQDDGTATVVAIRHSAPY